MKPINIEFLPQAVKEGVLTKTEAGKIIWQEVYLNPHQYGLAFFTEDQKSDLLLSIHPQFENIFDKFIPGNVNFKTFLAGCIANYKNAFLRKELKDEEEKHTIDLHLISQIEEDTQRYNPQNHTEEKKVSHESKTFSHFIRKTKKNSKESEKRIADLTLLILALKACKDIDDATIEQLWIFTGIDKELFQKKIEELKESIKNKEKYKLKLEKRRDNAFFFHRKYMQQMLSSRTNEVKIANLKKRYEMQTKRWKNNNKNLSVHSSRPSNTEIAKIIGLKTRTVSFYINHAKNQQILEKIRELYNREKLLTDEISEHQECPPPLQILP